MQQPVMMQQQPGQPMQQQQVVAQPVVQTGGWNYENVFANQGVCAIKQLIEMMEVMLGFETKNKYQAYFQNGVQLQCFEESDFFTRCICGPRRPFTMHIFCNKQEVLRFDRPLYFFLANLKVFDPRDNKMLGRIKQNFSLMERVFTVYVGEQPKYMIVCGCCEFWTFHIRDMQGQNVGSIRKQWSGLLKEMLTDADNFGVQFPQTATTIDRAVLFAATFLIDFLYFESSANSQGNSARFGYY